MREWFGDKLKQTKVAAWKEAHSRLYDHLRDTTHEGQTPTLADLAPLYHAIAHGCRAGRHQEALDEIYMNRICRRYQDGRLEFYASKKLGALGSNLAAISWFFDRPYDTSATALTPPDRAWVLSEASLCLRAEGRLREASPAIRTGLQMWEVADPQRNATNAASNLSQAELDFGDIPAAVATAVKSVALADSANDMFWMMANRALHADALHSSGEREKAEGLFIDAERRQRRWQPECPLLYSQQGYRYCDLLLSQMRAAEARNRAAQTLQWARRQNFVLDVACDALTLGRACLALALQRVTSGASAEIARDDARSAAASLDEAIEGLRASGANNQLLAACSRTPPSAELSAIGKALRGT